jgi:hypothetical protein
VINVLNRKLPDLYEKSRNYKQEILGYFAQATDVCRAFGKLPYDLLEGPYSDIENFNAAGIRFALNVLKTSAKPKNIRLNKRIIPGSNKKALYSVSTGIYAVRELPTTITWDNLG